MLMRSIVSEITPIWWGTPKFTNSHLHEAWTMRTRQKQMTWASFTASSILCCQYAVLCICPLYFAPYVFCKRFQYTKPQWGLSSNAKSYSAVTVTLLQESSGGASGGNHLSINKLSHTWGLGAVFLAFLLMTTTRHTFQSSPARHPSRTTSRPPVNHSHLIYIFLATIDAFL